MGIDQQTLDTLDPQSSFTHTRATVVGPRPGRATGTARVPPWLGPAALMVVPTPLLVGLLLHQFEPIPRLLLSVGAVLAAVIAAWVWQHDLFVHRRRNLAVAILISSSLAVASAVLWNDSYRAFSRGMPRKEVFRRNLMRYTTPAYGWTQMTSLQRGWPALLFGAVAVTLVLRTRFDRPVTRRHALLVSATMVGGIIAFASTEGPVRRWGQAPTFGPFQADAARFSGPADLLARYVQTMPTLSWFGCHYPPGSALLFMAQAATPAGFPLAYAVIALCTAISVVPVCLAARELAPKRPRVHHLAALAYMATTGPLVYASFSTTPLVLLPAATATYAFLRACRTGRVGPAVLLGVALPAFEFFAFSAAFFTLTLALCGASFWGLRLVPRRNVVRTVLIAVATGVAFVVALRLVSGFDLIACARAGLALHRQQAGTNGFDSAGPYFMRSTGNLLAFALSNLPLVGVLVTSMLLWKRHDWRLSHQAMLPAAVAAVLVAAFSGAFLLETERIWLFFVPSMVLAGAVELGRYDDRRGGFDARLAVVMMVVFSVTQELVFTHLVH